MTGQKVGENGAEETGGVGATSAAEEERKS